MTDQELCEDFNGVEGDGLCDGEVAFEGEEQCWEDWPTQILATAVLRLANKS
jgi:hypothetical protein